MVKEAIDDLMCIEADKGSALKKTLKSRNYDRLKVRF